MRKQPNADQCRQRLAASEAKSTALLVRIEVLEEAMREHLLKGGLEREVGEMRAEQRRLEATRNHMSGAVTKNRRLLAAAQTYSLDLRPK